MHLVPGRRRLMTSAFLSSLLPATRAEGAGGAAAAERLTTLHTFGDSILACAAHNAHGIHPGQLLVRNHDVLFPDFSGRDLQSLVGPARLAHHAVAGATVAGLPTQAQGLAPGVGRSVALLTVGGNDLLSGLAGDRGPGVRRFEAALERFVARLPIRPVLLGTVYDPTFDDDACNFLGVDARMARASLRRVNEAIASVASRHGRLVDLHAHFLGGDPSWFVQTIEPSLVGASEVRRAFLPPLLAALRAAPQ